MKVRYVGPYAEGVDIPAVVDGYHQLLHVDPGQEVDVSDELAEGLLSQPTNWEPTDPAGRKLAKAAADRLAEEQTSAAPLSSVAQIEQAHAAKTAGGSPKHHEERPIAVTEAEVAQ